MINKVERTVYTLGLLACLSAIGGLGGQDYFSKKIDPVVQEVWDTKKQLSYTTTFMLSEANIGQMETAVARKDSLNDRVNYLISSVDDYFTLEEEAKEYNTKANFAFGAGISGIVIFLFSAMGFAFEGLPKTIPNRISQDRYVPEKNDYNYKSR
ncbi:MAG: hypothetical protein ABIB43_05230 [archaeon]